MSARDELARVIAGTRFRDGTRRPQSSLEQADAILAAGYRKAEAATEYGIVFNRGAVFLTPSAHSLEEFKERYEREHEWMVTERDIFLTRTYTRCEPEPSAPVIYEPEAAK